MGNLRGVLKLELVADNVMWATKNGMQKRDFQKWLRLWKRLGPDKSFAWVRRWVSNTHFEWVNSTRDYTQANSKGSRGIYAYYALADGIYEVNHRYRWHKVRRYFVESQGGQICELERTDERVEKIFRENRS